MAKRYKGEVHSTSPHHASQSYIPLFNRTTYIFQHFAHPILFHIPTVTLNLKPTPFFVTVLYIYMSIGFREKGTQRRPKSEGLGGVWEIFAVFLAVLLDASVEYERATREH